MNQPTIDEMLEWLNEAIMRRSASKAAFVPYGSVPILEAIRAILEAHTTPILWEPDIDKLTIDELKQLHGVANNIGIDCMKRIHILEGQNERTND